MLLPEIRASQLTRIHVLRVKEVHPDANVLPWEAAMAE